MIRRLRIQFIVLAMLSLLLLLAVIVTGMNLLNYRSVISDADEVLSIISQNRGVFPNMDGGQGPFGRHPHGMSPELPYESRYFSVLLADDGTVIRVDTGRIASVDESQAVADAKAVADSDNEKGFFEQFRYIKTNDGQGTLITFLDCGRKLDAYHNFLLISIVMASAGFFIVFFVIVFFSGKFIQPIAESYEKQKRFITDAGHEIKTPLTIINANTDLLEMDIGENEYVDEIRQQAKRLTGLTNDLVSLARMEESDRTMPMIEFPLSEVVQDAAASFKAPAQAQNKQFNCNIKPMLSMNGNEEAISRLVLLLLDNALKYSPEGGVISLDLARQGKHLLLSVCNTVAEEINSEQLSHVFDRFYRSDPSRNSQTGGHGIGLSIAKAIVTAHGGKITAQVKGGDSFLISVVFSGG